MKKIPDIDIVDLETDNISDNDFTDENDTYDESTDYDENDNDDEEDYGKGHRQKRSRLPRFFNLHVLMLLVIVATVVLIFFKFKNWGIFIDQDVLRQEGEGIYEDTLDQILPLIDADGQMVQTDNSSIVFFGNAPFADDRGTDDNIVSMIEKSTGATVYNCSISGSYLSSRNYAFDADTDPVDAYSFYWLVALMTVGTNTHYFEDAADVLGDETPAEAAEVYDILTTVDFSTVDTAVIMYDASDYLDGRYMYNDENSTDVTCFTGNLEAGIELLKEYYPNMRIIVMSPTYAYAVVDGKYISSDIYTIEGLDVLSTYVIKEYGSASEQSVTFVDNLYGTITEDTAAEYLTDNLHLNIKGRKLVAQRLLYALNYYNED